jgi:hypothetical protein
MRYFFSTDYDNKPLNLYRFDYKADVQQVWGKVSLVWKPTDTVGNLLIRGEGWLDEVDEKTAKEAFPQAFKDSSK